MEYNRNLIVDTTKSGYYLSTPEDLLCDGYGKVTFLMNRPVEMVYDFIVYALKVDLEVHIVTQTDAYPIIDTNDLKQVYQILEMLAD